MRLSELSGERFAPDPHIAGLTADSREVAPGYLFAALPGTRADGAGFIPQAEERGAAAILARPGATSKLPIVFDEIPRRRLARMAARFFPGQPEVVAGVTGTNGKTSTVRFAAQLWSMLGRNAGSIGTLGAASAGFERKLMHTTPEPVTLHRTLQAMAEAGVTHLAMEVSSHALAQHRVDGVTFPIAAFTNITQDHLDYHGDFSRYLEAKRRLFSALLARDGVAIVNDGGEFAGRFSQAAVERGAVLRTVGPGGADLKIESADPHPGGLHLKVKENDAVHDVDLPLIGAFQAENALVAAAIVIESGFDAKTVLPLLEQLSPVPGRMELAARLGAASIYVDYAHTPDAVKTALQSLRPHVKGKLIAVIGAGGDRDREKRTLMGAAAHAHSDRVIVTDDNPRSEDPAAIRRQVIDGCMNAVDIGDRKKAIETGISMLEDGDALLIAGKGHETGQQVGHETLPFNDAEVAKAAALKRAKELGR